MSLNNVWIIPCRWSWRRRSCLFDFWRSLFIRLHSNFSRTTKNSQLFMLKDSTLKSLELYHSGAHVHALRKNTESTGVSIARQKETSWFVGSSVAVAFFLWFFRALTAVFWGSRMWISLVSNKFGINCLALTALTWFCCFLTAFFMVLFCATVFFMAP